MLRQNHIREESFVERVSICGCIDLSIVTGQKGTVRDTFADDRKRNLTNCEVKLEAPPGFEPGMEVLQTSALPLGDGADLNVQITRMRGGLRGEMERETGFEPATSTLARSHSTTELFPPAQTR
jgi:hypothetical protein